jgi:hydroxylaminobenzene mutase
MNNPSDHMAHRLIFLGIFLFFLGLVVGLFIPLMANPRMGLSTHLEAIMNGLFMIVLGLIWNRVNLVPRAQRVLFGLTLYGTFANFAAILIAALTGAGKMLPIALGKDQGIVLESIISFLLVTLALAMLAVCLMVMKGLLRYHRKIAGLGMAEPGTR